VAPTATIGLAALVTALAAACGGAQRPAVIGYAFQTSGAPNVAVARDEVASWPPGGRTVLFVFDSVAAGEPADVEIERAQRLVAVPGIVGVVGHAGSRGTLAGAPVYNEAGVPHVAPTSTSLLLRRAGPWTFSLAPDDSTEGAFIAEFVVASLGARAVSVFYANDEYGEGLRDGVRAHLLPRGVTLLNEVSFGPRSDVAPLVDAALRRGRPDAVISAGRWAETAALARQMAVRVPGIRVVAGDGAMFLPRLADSAGPAAAALYVVDFWVPDPADSASRAFVDRYRRVTGADPLGPQAMSHDALMLLARAVRDVGADRGAVRRYLESLGRERPPYPGITGPISFGPGRRTNLVMTRLVDGHPERVAWP
jgi:branched-chain amino acid transport system substrate-binding protein